MKLPRWNQSAWTVIDQGVVSSGNFLTNWILAKYLAPTEYGAFGLLFGLLLFANSLHSSLVTMPLGIRSPSAEPAEQKRLTGFALLFSLVLAVPMTIVCTAACVYLHRTYMLPWVVVAMALWFAQETLRRALMANLRHRDAVWGDVLSYLGQAAAIFYLQKSGTLTVTKTFLVMAVTSAVAALVQVIQTRVSMPEWASLRDQVRKFWSLGRWVLFANLANVLTVQAFPWSLAVFRGLQQAAAFQAVANLLGVSHPLIFGIGNLIVPASARAMAKDGIAEAKRAALSYGSQGAFLLVPYLVVLFCFPQTVLALFYGASSPYVNFTSGLRIFVIVYALIYLAQVLSSFFNAIERGQLAFLAYLSGAVIALFPGFPLIARAGMAGALITLLSCYSVRGALCVYYYRRAI
jgi:O-antigen/teichoic acid export membrane protein